MGVVIHEITLKFECSHFVDLFTVWSLLDCQQEIENDDWPHTAKATVLQESLTRRVHLE